MTDLLPSSQKFSSTRVAIFVPSTSGVNKNISSVDFKRRLRNTARYMTKKFGGTTRIRGVGTYSSKKKGIVEEKVGIVESFVPQDRVTKQSAEDFRKFVSDKRKAWGQESVAVEIESPSLDAESVFFVEE